MKDVTRQVMTQRGLSHHCNDPSRCTKSRATEESTLTGRVVASISGNAYIFQPQYHDMMNASYIEARWVAGLSQTEGESLSRAGRGGACSPPLCCRQRPVGLCPYPRLPHLYAQHSLPRHQLRMPGQHDDLARPAAAYLSIWR